MKLRWGQAAVRDLDGIHEFVSQDSPHDADQLIVDLVQRANQLERFPHSGRVVSEYEEHDGLREVITGSYRILYRVEEATVDVVAVIHGARMLPGDPPEYEPTEY